MTTGHTQRLRARIDRLPAGWVIVLAGFLLQFGLALGLFGLAYTDGEQTGMIVTAVLVGVVVIGGIAALPVALLLWWGRYPRAGATLAAFVAAGLLVVNEAHPTVWPFSLALFVAAVRVWAGAGLDAADLLRLDPARFERVDPPGRADDAAVAPASGESPEERSREQQ